MALFASLLFALVPASTQTPAPSPSLDVDAPHARVEAVPDHAHIGEPIELTFVVEHEDRATVALPDHTVLPRSIAFIEDLGLRRSDDPAHAGRKITRARWRVMALEGGDLSIPPLAITVDQSGKMSTLSAAIPPVKIESALQQGEDAPRSARGFRDTPAVHAWSLRGIVTALLLIVVMLIAIVVWKRRSRRQTLVAKLPSPIEQLATLEARARSEPDAVHNVTYALTALVRSAVDTHVGVHRDALTDADWSQAISTDDKVPEAVRTSAARLLASAERVKYGQESPSPLAVRDWMDEARKALEALGETPRIAA